ncbi:hypothetical protein GCM10010498_23970 [Streptomyces cavourensis]|nr:hypothetical protein GCM10010498_23970 [Streptomyces cavourensis]
MLALHRSGRDSEAPRRVRAAPCPSGGGAGLRAGAPLRALHARLLAQDPELMELPTLREDSPGDRYRVLF